MTSGVDEIVVRWKVCLRFVTVTVLRGGGCEIFGVVHAALRKG